MHCKDQFRILFFAIASKFLWKLFPCFNFLGLGSIRGTPFQKIAISNFQIFFLISQKTVMVTTPMEIVYQTAAQLFWLEQKTLWSSPPGGLHQKTHGRWQGPSSWHPTGNPFQVSTHEGIICRSCRQAWSLTNFLYTSSISPDLCNPKMSSKRLNCSSLCSTH